MALSQVVSITAPRLLHLSQGAWRSYGADQVWYSTQWQQRAGCGPTTGSHLMWYYANRKPGYEALCDFDASDRDGFLGLMEDVWHYITPGKMGVNSPVVFAQGVERYAESKGLALSCDTLMIPSVKSLRPSMEEVSKFLGDAIADDLPVAFLNLNNGALHNLDSWHWVTLVAVNREHLTALMYDQGKCICIDLQLWLHSSFLGGAFVVARPK